MTGMAKVLSIEIGILTTKIVEMDFKAKKPRIYNCLEIPTPDGAVIDGYLIDEKIDVLKNAISAALADNKIRTKKVIFTVFSNKIISREVMIPAVKPHQINAVISSNVTDYFPVELEDYKLSHIHLSTFKDGPNAGKHMVLVVAMEKSLIEVYNVLAEKLNLHIVDIDYAGNSVYQATKSKVGSDAVLVAKIEADNTIVTILKKGNLVLQRGLNTGYAESNETAHQVSADSIDSVVSTIIRLIDFYTGNNDNNVVDHVFVIGEGASKPEVVDAISRETNLPCRVLESISGVTIQRSVKENIFFKYMSAIGAGIGSIGFDTEKEKERHATDYFNACILMLILLVVIVFSLLFHSFYFYNSALKEADRITEQEEFYAQAKDIHDKYLGYKEFYNHMMYGNALTMNSNDSILVFFEELERLMPEDVVFTEFASDDKQSIITMRVADKETAAGVIKVLREEFTSIKSVSVESITEENIEVIDASDEDIEVSPMGHVLFTINCVYEEIQLPDNPAEEKEEVEAE